MECIGKTLNEVNSIVNTDTNDDVKKKKKIVKKKNIESRNDFIVKIPSYSEYEYVKDKRLKVLNLKAICKHYKLKVTGNKNQLQSRLYDYLLASSKCYKLQAALRRLLVRTWLQSHGPALFDRSKAVNATDFATMDKVEDIPADQVFSFADNKSETVYVFDVGSFATLMKENILRYCAEVKNPYTMENFDRSIFQQFDRFIRLSKVLGRHVEYEIKDEDESGSDEGNQSQLTTSERINRVFHEMDSYGHYTNGTWLEEMSNINIRHFIYEVIQIFEYRAHLSSGQRARIVPPSGILHRGNVRTWLSNNLSNREQLLDKAITLSEILVFSSPERDNRQLGCYYVLMALTLTSEAARSSMPWLYEAASYS